VVKDNLNSIGLSPIVYNLQNISVLNINIAGDNIQSGPKKAVPQF